MSARDDAVDDLSALTPRVTLRGRTPADDDLLYLVASDLDTWEERRADPPAPLSRQQYAARSAARDETSPDPDVSFVVDVDGAPAGTIGLYRPDALARHAELGIALAPGFRGRGIGTEALRQMLDFGFDRHNLRRIHLELLESNLGARRAYEKAGFVEEGRRREHAWVRGRYEDMVMMGIMRAEHRR